MAGNKDRISAFALESQNLSKVGRPSYMPMARKTEPKADTEETQTEENSTAAQETSAADTTDHPVTNPDEPDTASKDAGIESVQNEPVSTTDASTNKEDTNTTESTMDTPAEDIKQEEPVGKETARKPGRPKKGTSDSSPYKKRSSALAGNQELDETIPVTLKLTPYTKALLETIFELSGHSCQSELADVAIHNYIIKEYPQFLPYTDILFRHRFPDAPDEKQLHKKK